VGKRLAHYQILERVAVGGMGAIYRSRNLRLDKVVALKVLPQHLVEKDKSFAERFIREARYAAKLEHPNVVTIYSVDFQENHLFIEMQFVEGQSLRQWIKDKKRLSPADAMRVTLEVARAMAAAHAKGIVHRDIKPDNILLTREGQVKVTDFGIAGIADAGGETARPKLVMGTPHYMSPEQCRGDKVDPRSDIYSLGATFFHMLTGRFPFEGATAMAVVQKHVEAPLPSPRSIVPDIAESVCRIVAKMMAKDPGMRHQDCSELIADLKAVAVEKGYKLDLPGTEPETQAPPKRGRRKAVAVVVSLLVAAGVAAVLLTPRARAFLASQGVDFTRWLGAKTVPVALSQAPQTPAPRTVKPPRPQKPAPAGEAKKPAPAPEKTGANHPAAPVAKPPQAPAKPLPTAVAVKPPAKPSEAPAKPPEAPPKPPVKEQPKPPEAKQPPVRRVPEGPPPHPMVASLGELKIPRGMVYVPQGKTPLRGLEVTDEPRYLDAFFIDKCEVSNEQYSKFVDDSGHAPPQYWRGGMFPVGRENFPVTGVSYSDAEAYAKWAGKRLPSNFEWEKAARGAQAMEYPWGKEWDKWKVQTLFSLGYRDDDSIPARRWLEQYRKSDKGKMAIRLGGATVPVDRNEDAPSPFKCLNMIGNAAEWTSGVQRTEQDAAGGERVYRIVCGSSWATGNLEMLTAHGCREYLAEDTERDDVGFRCALDAPNIQGGAAALKPAPSAPPAAEKEKGKEEGKGAVVWPKDGIERDYAKYFKPLRAVELSSAETVQKDGGQIVGDVVFSKGRGGVAPRLQDGMAFISVMQKLPVESGGLEFWLRMPPAEATGVLVAGLAGRTTYGGFSVVLLPQGGLSFTAEPGGDFPPVMLRDASIGDPQKWVHVAVQWGQRKHRIYINGKLRQQDNSVSPLPSNLRGFAIGAPHSGQALSPLGVSVQPVVIDGVIVFGPQ
jgi:serine/threonine-protein kinase